MKQLAIKGLVALAVTRMVSAVAPVVALAVEPAVMTNGLYTLKPAAQTNGVVTRIDLGVVRASHLAQYDVQRDAEDKRGEKELVVYNKDSKEKIEIRTRMFDSVSAAEKGVLDWLNSVSVVFAIGSPSGRAIGDNCWYYTTKATGATTVVFVRKNIVVTLFARKAELAVTLAEQIDADIAAGKNGVEAKERKETAILPVP